MSLREAVVFSNSPCFQIFEAFQAKRESCAADRAAPDLRDLVSDVGGLHDNAAPCFLFLGECHSRGQ